MTLPGNRGLQRAPHPSYSFSLAFQSFEFKSWDVLRVMDMIIIVLVLA